MTTSDYRGILYNFNNTYWQENADLIPAISCAIDRQAIVDAVLLGRGEVAYSPLQRNIYNDPDVERWDYDPARAEQLLTEAGCTKDSEGFWQRSGQRIGFTINASPDDQVRIDMAQPRPSSCAPSALTCRPPSPPRASTGAGRSAASSAGAPPLTPGRPHL